MWAPQNKQEFSRMLMPTYCKHKRVEQHTNECLNRPEPRYDHAAVYDRNGNVIGWYDEYDDFSRADTLTSSDGVWALTSPTKRGSTRP